MRNAGTVRHIRTLSGWQRPAPVSGKGLPLKSPVRRDCFSHTRLLPSVHSFSIDVSCCCNHIRFPRCMIFGRRWRARSNSDRMKIPPYSAYELRWQRPCMTTSGLEIERFPARRMESRSCKNRCSSESINTLHSAQMRRHDDRC